MSLLAQQTADVDIYCCGMAAVGLGAQSAMMASELLPQRQNEQHIIMESGLPPLLKALSFMFVKRPLGISFLAAFRHNCMPEIVSSKCGGVQIHLAVLDVNATKMSARLISA